MHHNENKNNRLVTKLLGQPVYRLILVGVITIGLIPVGIPGFRLYQVAWTDAWREINEKHRVLAMNLASPVRIYVKDRLAMLDMMAQEIENASRTRLNVPASKRLMQSAFTRMTGFRAISLVAPAGQTRALIHQGNRLPKGDMRFTNETRFVKTRNTGTPAISNAKFSPTDGAPTIILSQPVRSANGALTGTGLPNRRHFERHLLSTLRNRSSRDEPLCIISIDIDNFKEINDRHGHAAGDIVLTDVAEILSNAVRSSNDLVARYGGDEFVAQLNCPVATASERSNKIRREIAQHDFLWGDSPINVTVSIGVLEVNNESSLDMESVLHDVDHAMYQAKRRGRNTVAKLVR